MIRLRSIFYPGNKHQFNVFQEYAAPFYMTLFSILMLILFYQLARRAPILFPGTIGAFSVVILSNAFAIVNMKRKQAEMGFHEGHFYVRSVYDSLLKREPNFFPLPYSNPQLKGDRLYVTYFDRILCLNPYDWENWNDIMYFFGFKHYSQ